MRELTTKFAHPVSRTVSFQRVRSVGYKAASGRSSREAARGRPENPHDLGQRPLRIAYRVLARKWSPRGLLGIQHVLSVGGLDLAPWLFGVFTKAHPIVRRSAIDLPTYAEVR